MSVPVDLTVYGSIFTAQARADQRSVDEVSFAVDATQAAGGQLTLSLTAVQTAALSRSAYGFDLQATSTDGTHVSTLLTGALAVDGDYTR